MKSQGYGGCCFPFIECTHLTVLEGAQCYSCQGNDNLDNVFCNGLLLSSLPQSPRACREARDKETRRDCTVCPAQVPPASSSAGGCHGACGAQHRPIGSEMVQREYFLLEDLKTNLRGIKLRHVFPLFNNRHWFKTHHFLFW